MRTSYIDVDGYWGVLMCHDLDWDDADKLTGYLRAFHVSQENIRECLDVVLGGVNCACCVSSYDTTMSLVLIGPATTKEQLIDSVAHELDHVEAAIARFYGFSLDSEDAAYTQGYLTRQAMKAVMPGCLRS